MSAYFDASALAKLYLDEPGASLVRTIQAGHNVAMSRLSEVEVASALRRRHAGGDLSPADCDRMLADWELDRLQFSVVELDATIAAAARRLLASQLLRASDAVQLASALTHRRGLGKPTPFVCFDIRLAAAAMREGLQVIPEVKA
ncbi:MAG: type II toxin-antitoxin system VapC family toxin [Terriglobales bacterium]